MGRPPSCLCGNCYKCKHRAAQREWYRSLTLDERREWMARRDKDKQRARDRARHQRPERKAYVAEKARLWRQRYPERAKAHFAVSNAIRDGKLQKGPCEVCGDGRVHGHHDDYTKPLEVRWLCPKHHAQHHQS